MAHENKILHVSLFVGIVGLLAGGSADAAVRIGNKTKNDAYRQYVAANTVAVNAAAPVVTNAELPVRVANEDLAKEIQNGTASITATHLESCKKIYPNGEFAWDHPTAGVGAGGANTCVAVVELRGYQMGPGGSDVVLARANVAAGSSVKCNISDFPEYSYTLDAQNVVFPADSEPTTADVINVLNQEQKQNAGLKIAAATLVGAIGGNIAGKNDVGKDGLVGTDKGKIQGTVIGALSGAAIGAGGAYAGKVGGDMIMSTGINAAAGGVVGNIVASGDDVLRIEDCKDDDGNTAKCLWGYVVEGVKFTDNGAGELCEEKNKGNCITAYYDLQNRTVMTCDKTNCKSDNLTSIYIKKNKNETAEINSLKQADYDALKMGTDNLFRLEKKLDGTSEMKSGGSSDSAPYVRIVSAMRPTTRKPAMIWGFNDKFFGLKRSDWYAWKAKNPAYQIVARDARGNASGVLTVDSLNNFEPMYISADDGGIIDLDNKARLKGTMIGAGAGGALGAFTAYQGAQSDIDERWVSAVREYRDSLQKFVCFTGNRFLSYYNDTVEIPDVNE